MQEKKDITTIFCVHHSDGSPHIPGAAWFVNQEGLSSYPSSKSRNSCGRLGALPGTLVSFM